MKYLDEYRDRHTAQAILREIRQTVTQPWVIMEVCGGQTHSIVRYGLDQLLPRELELVHGPGCPVCVTPLETIDKAHAIARQPDVILASFGDMLRVPGSRGDLLTAKAQGADVRVVYSPLDALSIARAHPERRVVFLAVGFETTAPANAMALWQAKQQGIKNFSMLVSHVLVPPAMASIQQTPGNRVQAFLGPGHVCTVMGCRPYEAICRTYHTPVVVTGFEPVDLLQGVLEAVRMLERGEARVENAYARSVSHTGNPAARALLAEVFEVIDRKWRGVGFIPKSGYRIAYELREYDAEWLFDVGDISPQEPAACISGQILRGLKKPSDCPAFGRECTPLTPLGATMVSAEGACAAYFQYGRHRQTQEVSA